MGISFIEGIKCEFICRDYKTINMFLSLLRNTYALAINKAKYNLINQLFRMFHICYLLNICYLTNVC